MVITTETSKDKVELKFIKGGSEKPYFLNLNLLSEEEKQHLEDAVFWRMLENADLLHEIENSLENI
jgi:hypothetical protein